MKYYIEKKAGNIHISAELDNEKITLTRRTIKAFSLDNKTIKCYMQN